MPSMEVAIELKPLYHRNGESRGDSNTIFDIDAMSIALPYCDAVVADNEVRAMLSPSELATRMDTVLLSRPDELGSRLAAWLLAAK
jgi:hypothetical protein